MTDPSFLTTLAAFFVAAASPGPATLALAATAMARGGRVALRFGLGLSAGLALWGVVAAAGLGAVLVQSAGALAVLRLAGGLYLLYLALKSARSALSCEAREETAAGADVARPMLRGLLLNVSNPKAVLAWMAVLSLGIGPGDGAAHLALVTGACSLVGAAIYAGYALAFAQSPVRAAYRASRRAIEGVVAGLFAYAGVRLILSRGGGAG